MKCVGGISGAWLCPAWAVEFEEIAPQPFFASVMRAIAALTEGGQPIAKVDADRLAELAAQDDAEAVAGADTILGKYTLATVMLDKEGMGQATLGGADRTLIEQGWRSFLIRVENPHGVTDRFDVSGGGGAGRMSQPNLEEKAGLRDTLFKAPLIEKLWLTAQIQASQPLSSALVEYKVVDFFSRDRGRRQGTLGFGAGTVEVNGRSFDRAAWSAWRNPLVLDVTARPTEDVTLSLLDSDGIGCMASLIIKDRLEHVYPPQVMRLAPDMFFHPHIYRADGETVRLPDGDYVVTSWRGPEYLRKEEAVRVSGENRRIAVKLERWIDPAEWGWYSGDTHIHAAGCAHYMHPTEGVTPETMIRHVRGEGLAIGDVLTWGPAWYHQKQFFTGSAISPDAKLEYPDLQAANNASFETRPTPKDHESLLRYDIEVSQFPSSLSGHLILLRIKEQDYPGTKAIEDWPSWNLPILQWGREQGAVVGLAHCGLGMAVSSNEIPNYEVPPFDSIGTNEAIVDVTHDACDFLSGCEFEPAQELNAWYHMLNCGLRLTMVGETDYPCITGERPGVGRSYVQLDRRPTDDAGYNAWVEGIRSGRLYCGDGRSHFLEVAVNGRTMGETVALERAGSITVDATIAARLEPSPTDETRAITAGWHLERARIGESRTVPLELVVNGQPVEQVEFLADGKPRPVRFKTPVERSSWVALRILPSGHTHPVFVVVEDKPIRASRRSAEWLRKCVDALWTEKHRLMRESERPIAAEAYDHARRTYERIMAESELA
jgi:hypothetical protein